MASDMSNGKLVKLVKNVALVYCFLSSRSKRVLLLAQIHITCQLSCFNRVKAKLLIRTECR